MILKKFDALSGSELWWNLLETLPPECRDIYFTPEYHRLHSTNGDGPAFCHAATEDNQALAIPGLHMSFAGEIWDFQTCNGYGGPVASAGSGSNFLEQAWDKWRASCASSGCIAALFRLHPLLNNERWLPRDATVLEDRKTVFVDLSQGVEFARSSADARHRNRLNKARRNGCSVRWNEADDWRDFAELYRIAMDRLNAPERLRFNEHYHAALRCIPGAQIAAVRISGKLTAAAVYLFGNSWGHYHLGARRDDADNFLMNLIFDSGLETASALGLRGVHFGGGRTSSPDDTLFRFKKKLGGRLLEFKVALVPVDNEKFAHECRKWSARYGTEPKWLLGYRQPDPSLTAAAPSP